MNFLVENLKQYADFLAKIRAFFAKNKVIEVHTPSLLTHPTLDSNIDSIKVQTNAKFTPKNYYLHTSPELEMKKLLTKGSGDIYQICRVYRDNEIGKHNFNEFEMLEYYLTEVTTDDLIENILQLFQYLGIKKNVYYFSYNALLMRYANIDISLNYEELQQFAKANGLTTELGFADLQILVWVHFVEEHLKNYPICVIYDFPKEQSAYAKVRENVAKRFEIYINGSEIANGYEELQTYDEYLAVFNTQAKHSNLPINNEFLDCLRKHSLPQCSGVAIGVGRLFTSLTASSLA